MSKYIKPRSLTWWSGVGSIFLGLFAGTAPIHGLYPWVDAIQLTTGLNAPLLVMNGFAVIGLRGALHDAGAK